jgi:histidinol-phosphate/aromatic aminotransferase/cobyric acid decarboxylase-like protein
MSRQLPYRLIDASSGISPLGPSRRVKSELRRAIKSIDNSPASEIKKLSKLFLSKYGIDENRIIFGNSISELLSVITSVYRPKNALIAGPALGIYESALSASRAGINNLIFDEKTGFSIDTEVLTKAAGNADIVFVSNPNRVTGRLYNRKALYEALSHIKAPVVLDESLVEFTSDDDFILNYDNIIILRSTAFFYGMPGLETAYAVSSCSEMEKMRKGIVCGVNSLAAAAARAALKDKTYKKTANNFISNEKKLIINYFEKTGGIICYGSDTNMFLVRLENNNKLGDSLRKEGFLINDCSDIYGLGRAFLRFSVMRHEYNRKFIKILCSCQKNIISDI